MSSTETSMIDVDETAGSLNLSGRSMKRKLEEALQSLDEAVGPVSDATEQQPPPKRPRIARSIYSTLAKYGIKSKDSRASFLTERSSSSLSKAPHLSAILARTRKAIPFKFPASDHAPMAASPSFADYRPSSTQAFMLRLSTFKLPTYSSKPHAIDAVAAAKCGWINDGKERLVCGMCTASWIVAGRDGLSREAANALVEKQRVSLVQHHKDGCPWKMRQCDDAVYRIPLRSPLAMAREIKTRAVRLDSVLQGVQIKHPLTSNQVQALASTIRSVSNAVSSVDLDLEVPQRPSTPPSGEDPVSLPETETQPSETAVLTALFGWDIAPPAPSSSRHSSTSSRASSLAPSVPGTPSVSRPPSVNTLRGTERATTPLSISLPKRLGSHLPHTSNSTGTNKRDSTLLYCCLCQRRVGLWAFAPQNEESRSVASPTQSSFSRVQRPQRSLDLLLEHRNYCPYVVRSTIIPSLPVPGATIDKNATTVTQLNMTAYNHGPIEGWRAVLHVVSRYGLAERQKRLVRRMASGNEGSAPGGGIDGVMEGETRAEIDGVEAMMAGVKTRGGKELLKYVKGLLG